MIPQEFEYHRAASIDEALRLMARHGDSASLLAGGHSLLPAMKLRLNAPAHLIDISRIDELNTIRMDGDTLCIGAAATHFAIASSADAGTKAPVIALAAASIGDVQVRNKGTLGGSIAHADPAADYPAALLAADADIVVRGASGSRTIAAVDFFEDIFVTALNEGEIVTEIRVPAVARKTGSSYMKFAQPASRFAIVGCAVVATVNSGTVERIRVAFNGVSSAGYRATAVESALTGKPADAAAISAAAVYAADGIDIMSDHFASEDFRKHLATVYARRAISEAVSRA